MKRKGANSNTSLMKFVLGYTCLIKSSLTFGFTNPLCPLIDYLMICAIWPFLVPNHSLFRSTCMLKLHRSVQLRSIKMCICTIKYPKTLLHFTASAIVVHSLLRLNLQFAILLFTTHSIPDFTIACRRSHAPLKLDFFLI